MSEEKDMENATIEDIKKERTLARRKFNKVVKDLEVFLRSNPAKSLVEELLKDCTEKYFVLRKIIDQLEDVIVDDAELDTSEKYSSNLLEDFSNISQNAQIYIRQSESDIKKEKQIPSGSVKMQHKLERLKISTFSGNIRDYPSWKIRFEHAMVKYQQDSEEQLQRLQGALNEHCEIKRDVGLLACSTIEAAWKILENRYGDINELISLLLKDIKDYSRLKNTDYKTLRNYASAVRLFVTRMEELGHGEEVKDHSITWQYLYCIFILLAFVTFSNSQSTFTWQACLNAHNKLRSNHIDTAALQYSSDLQYSAQQYADQLARSDDWDHDPRPTRVPPKRRDIPDIKTTPFIHKETWDGDIYFPLSSPDLNKGREEPIGESIHKFCCYSWPFCPEDEFNSLSFPPPATNVVNSWYGEIEQYDFDSGVARNNLPVEHFTNVVWKKTTEIGCAQSRRSPAGCIYTVAHYKSQGSVGWAASYKMNVQKLGSSVDSSSSSSGKTIVTVFMILLLLIILCVVAFIVYMKRVVIIETYQSYKKSRKDARNNDCGNDDEDQSWMRYFRRRKKNIIYKPRRDSNTPGRPPLRASDIVHSAPVQARRPTLLEPREPTSNDVVVTFQQPDNKNKVSKNPVVKSVTPKQSTSDAPRRPKTLPAIPPPQRYPPPTKVRTSDIRPNGRPLPSRPLSLANLRAPPKPLPRKPSDVSSRSHQPSSPESDKENEAVATLRAELKKLASKPTVKPRSHTVTGMSPEPERSSPKSTRPDKERSNTTATSDSKDKAMENLRTELEKLAGRSAPNTPKEGRSPKGSRSAPTLKPQPAKRPVSARPSQELIDGSPNLETPRRSLIVPEKKRSAVDVSPSNEPKSFGSEKTESEAMDSNSPLLPKNNNHDDADKQNSVAEMRRLLANKGIR